jgi:hypothetical protein
LQFQAVLEQNRHQRHQPWPGSQDFVLRKRATFKRFEQYSDRLLDKCWETLEFGTALGFGAGQRAHLVGIGDFTTAWLKEARAAKGKRFESVVLFALDQFCLIGYAVPLPDGPRRSFRSGI